MTNPISRVLRLPDVLKLTGFRSKETIRKLELAGNFPKRFTLNPAATKEKGQKGWFEHEIFAYLKARGESRDSGAAE